MKENRNELRKKIENYSYGLNDHLDTGHKSNTFRGLNEQTEEKVAIKVVDLRGKEPDFVKQQLSIEIEIHKKLSHPNLIHYYDVYSTVNNCYIITEFCDQGDLENRITTRGALKEAEAIVFFKDILNGFLYLAQEKYIHGNLKLSCLFIKDKVIKISGLSNSRKIGKEGKDFKREVRFNSYQSPESVKDSIFTHKSDIWSIGMILYVLLHGNFPWEYSSKAEFLEKVSKPFTINKELSEEVKQFLQKTLTTKQNRISMEELMINPFAKKLINTEDVVRYVTGGGLSESPTAEKHRKDTYHTAINRVEKHINAQINWMRFLFRLIDRIMSYPQEFNTYVLKFIMIRQLAAQYEQLKRSLERGENPFNFSNWNEFVKEKEKVRKYREIMGKYDERFMKAFANYKKFVDKISANNTLSYLSPVINENFIISEFNCMVAIKVSMEEVKKLWGRIVKEYPAKGKYDKESPFRFKAELLLLDFLVSYYQLNCLWIDNFHLLDNFEKNSKLQLILDNQPVDLDASHLGEFQFKLTQLGIIP